jgi:endonuclease III
MAEQIQLVIINIELAQHHANPMGIEAAPPLLAPGIDLTDSERLRAQGDFLKAARRLVVEPERQRNGQHVDDQKRRHRPGTHDPKAQRPQATQHGKKADKQTRLLARQRTVGTQPQIQIDGAAVCHPQGFTGARPDRQQPGCRRRKLMAKMTKAQAQGFYARLAQDSPEPQTELAYGNSYQLLVAVVLSAQATDVGVNKATARLFAQVFTPQQMLELGEEGLKAHIRTIGLFNAKAANVIALSRLLVERHAGQVPESREALEDLPGVGRKTANVVLNVAFGQETCAVDTHIFRIGNRTGLAPGKTPLAVEQGILKITPAAFRRHAHHWLILHGRYVCKARKPECWRCTVAQFCQFKDKSPPP